MLLTDIRRQQARVDGMPSGPHRDTQATLLRCMHLAHHRGQLHLPYACRQCGSTEKPSDDGECPSCYNQTNRKKEA